MKKPVLVALLPLLFSLPAAADCGEAPVMQGSLPDGARATADEIRAARAAVLEWSDKIDAYMACMDRVGAKLLPWLTQEQQDRREADLAEIHNKRREAQIELNAAIRAWRAAQNDSGQSGSDQ